MNFIDGCDNFINRHRADDPNCPPGEVPASAHTVRVFLRTCTLLALWAVAKPILFPQQASSEQVERRQECAFIQNLLEMRVKELTDGQRWAKYTQEGARADHDMQKTVSEEQMPSSVAQYFDDRAERQDQACRKQEERTVFKEKRFAESDIARAKQINCPIKPEIVQQIKGAKSVCYSTARKTMWHR